MTEKLATISKGALETVPEYLKSYGAQGADDGGVEDLVFPRLALAQSGHDEVKKSSGKQIEGLEEGDFFNTLTKRVYGDKVVVVPISFFKNYIAFRSQDEGGGVTFMSNTRDGIAPERLAFGPDGEKPEVTEFRNFLCVLPEYDNELAVVSLKSTATKVAKEWYTLTRFGGAPIFAKKYVVSSKADKRGENSFMAWVVTPKGFNLEADAGKYAQLRKDFGANVKFDIEKPDEEGDESFDTSKSEM